MDRQTSKRALPNTPRINDKILEYYQKFGQDRDLEKFMRIYSPSASSQDSQRTQRNSGNAALESCCMRTRSRETISSSNSSCDALAMMPSHPMSSGCCGVNSKSMPNIDVQGASTSGVKDIVVDISIELEKDKEKQMFSTSSECILTPKRNPICDEVQTKTPESVAKAHRRLEWDSLGDIGYKKSMSTSNISVLERSLLMEFFKENTVTSEPSASDKQDDGRKNKAQHQEQHKNVKVATKSLATESVATPPLACSTLVGEGLNGNVIKRGAKAKMISQSTSSTSLQKKFEKYAQTSLVKPANTQCQEVQVSMSSSASVIEGTATPSSFEYRSSRSSRSSKSSEYVPSDSTNKHLTAETHPFITSITELLMKKRGLSENNQDSRQQLQNIRGLQSTLQAALDENKENQTQSRNTASSSATSFSLTRHAPELDLGIQLICSLIDAKSVTGKQKKKLIRDIVKRITKLNGDEGVSEATLKSNESGSQTHPSMSSEKHSMYDSVYSRRHNVSSASVHALPGSKTIAHVPSDLGLTPINVDASQGQTKSYVSSTTINSASEKIIGIHAYQENIQDKQHTNTRSSLKKVLCNKLSPNGRNKNKLAGYQQKTATYENRIRVPNLTETASPRRRNKGMSSELISKQKKTSRETTLDTENRLMLNSKQTRSTQTSKLSSTSTGSKKSHTSSTTRTTSSGGVTTTTTSSSSSHDLPTQKSLRKPVNSYNVDENKNTTMLEWLNPLTQSEIEYEEKKRMEIEKKAKEEALKRERRILSTKHDSGRTQQLSWIESEIQRLECLKHLLLKDSHDKSSTLHSVEESCNHHKDTENSTQTEKLYDTVYSDKSSVLSESAERLVNEIEIILEESNEDVVNQKDNSKTTKERIKETHVVYEKLPDNCKSNEKCNNAKFRSIKETVTINEKKLLINDNSEGVSQPPPVHRQKIATPTFDQSPENAESLRDLVKQKKRDFMELYKTKKQNHYEALKQQQKEQTNFKYLPAKARPIFTKSEMPVKSCTGHYSIPHTVNRNFSPTEYAYPQSHLPPTPENRQTKISSDIVYSTAATDNQHKAPHLTNSTTTTTTATSCSSTSMFCVSSDVSVPMGSNNSTSTPTTTHHYDDVAAAVAGVAVQTSESVQRSQPIFGATLQPYLCPKRLNTQVLPLHSTAAIQVKPKGIAYVIEFDTSKKTNGCSQESVTNLNVNPLTESATTANTNDVKAVVVKASSDSQMMTLQDHLEKGKPKFLKQSKERKAILNQLQAMRQARDRQLREIIDNTSFNSLERRLRYLPPPPTQKIRILTTKDMKALTNKRCASLPEVVARQQREQEEKIRRGNRKLRDVFNLRLQRRVRSGKLSLNHSRTVI